MQAILVGCGDGQTEIYQAHSVVGRNHDVVRLDVAMYNVLRVRMIDRLEETPHIAGSLPFCENLVHLLADLIVER